MDSLDGEMEKTVIAVVRERAVKRKHLHLPEFTIINK